MPEHEEITESAVPDYQIIEVLVLVESTQENPADTTPLMNFLVNDPDSVAASAVLRDVNPHDGAVFADFLKEDA